MLFGALYGLLPVEEMLTAPVQHQSEYQADFDTAKNPTSPVDPVALFLKVPAEVFRWSESPVFSSVGFMNFSGRFLVHDWQDRGAREH